MSKKLARAIIQKLIEKKVLTKEDEELYIYGMKQFFDFALNVIAAVVVGFIFDMLWQSIVFSIAYIFLRKYAGGYHAPNSKICYILSVLLIAVSMLIIRMITITWWKVAIGIISSIALIFLKAPVESKNKPLDSKEKKIYGRYARFVAVLEEIIVIVFFITGLMEACACVLVALFMSSTLLLFSDKIYEKI